jgi:hypothetical protein
MAVVIFAGVVLSTTPFILEYFFPLPKESLQYANSEDAENALKRWFNSENAEIKQVKAARERLADVGVNSYFSFETSPDVITTFIRLKKLQQLELTDEVMQSLFVNAKISWWQPKILTRETYFSGEDKGILLYLIYNAQLKRGFLLLQQ